MTYVLIALGIAALILCLGVYFHGMRLSFKLPPRQRRRLGFAQFRFLLIVGLALLGYAFAVNEGRIQTALITLAGIAFYGIVSHIFNRLSAKPEVEILLVED